MTYPEGKSYESREPTEEELDVFDQKITTIGQKMAYEVGHARQDALWGIYSHQELERIIIERGKRFRALGRSAVEAFNGNFPDEAYDLFDMMVDTFNEAPGVDFNYVESLRYNPKQELEDPESK
jgi:hypothetical protein